MNQMNSNAAVICLTPSNEAVALSPKGKESILYHCKYLIRKALQNLDNMDIIQRDVMEALTMAAQAEEGFLEPNVINSDDFDRQFYSKLKSFKQADTYYNIESHIFRQTISNKAGFDDKTHMKEIENTTKTLSQTAKILDTITFNRIKRNKQ